MGEKKIYKFQSGFIHDFLIFTRRPLDVFVVACASRESFILICEWTKKKLWIWAGLSENGLSAETSSDTRKRSKAFFRWHFGCAQKKDLTRLNQSLRPGYASRFLSSTWNIFSSFSSCWKLHKFSPIEVDFHFVSNYFIHAPSRAHPNQPPYLKTILFMTFKNITHREAPS